MGRLLPQRTSFALGATVLAAVALLAGACGGDQGIRISAITSTPASGEGTATPTPTSVLSSVDEDTLVPVPPLPDNPFGGGRDVEAYLAAGDPDLAGCLPDLVRTWGLADETEGPRCLSVDIDGDRDNEFAFLISFGVDAGPQPSDLWFFESAGEDFRFFNSGRAIANASTSGLHIRHVEDLTDDGKPEIVATWEDCGASTCVTNLLIASHHNGILEDLAPDDSSIESMEEFEIEGGVITMQGGTIASVGAGPQRGATQVVSWAGSRFRLETEPGEAAYLVHLVNDADRAFAAAEYAEAGSLYLEAASNASLPDWKAETGQAAGRTELQAYSTFRAALAAERSGDSSRSLALLRQAADDYQGSMHGSIAEAYLEAIEGGATPGEACSTAEIFIESFQGLFVQFWDYGSANPQRTVFTLCR